MITLDRAPLGKLDSYTSEFLAQQGFGKTGLYTEGRSGYITVERKESCIAVNYHNKQPKVVPKKGKAYTYQIEKGKLIV